MDRFEEDASAEGSQWRPPATHPLQSITQTQQRNTAAHSKCSTRLWLASPYSALPLGSGRPPSMPACLPACVSACVCHAPSFNK